MGSTVQRQQDGKRHAKAKRERNKQLSEELNKATWGRLRHDLILSPAFRSLSYAARSLFLELFARYNGFNNGSISLTYTELTQFGVAPATAKKGFSELEENGFIKKTIQGGRGRSGLTFYALTCFKIDENKTFHLEATLRPSDDWKLREVEKGV